MESVKPCRNQNVSCHLENILTVSRARGLHASSLLVGHVDAFHKRLCLLIYSLPAGLQAESLPPETPQYEVGAQVTRRQCSATGAKRIGLGRLVSRPFAIW
jgi:hypothetical protein